MKKPNYPFLYQINTRVWPTELSHILGRRATLDDIPGKALDQLAEDLVTKKDNDQKFPRRIFFAEMLGTALLLLIGLSLVILMFGSGSPVPRLIPGIGYRRLITGFLFGSTGALIPYLPSAKLAERTSILLLPWHFTLWEK